MQSLPFVDVLPGENSIRDDETEDGDEDSEDSGGGEDGLFG